MALHCTWFSEIDHTTDRHTTDTPCLVFQFITFDPCEKSEKISTTQGAAQNLNFYRKIWIFGAGSYIGGDRQFSTQEEPVSETLDLGLGSTTGAESAKTG